MKQWLNKTFDIIFYIFAVISLIGLLAYSANNHKYNEMQYKRDSLEYELLKIEHELLTK
jgi:hypothetical protein